MLNVATQRRPLPFGTVSGRLGALATESFGRYWALATAVLSPLAALVASWGPRLSVFQLEAVGRPGLAGAFSYRFVLSLGTSVAPLLFLLTVSAANARPASGFLLAFTFGLGRGLPFVLAGLVATAVTRLTRLGRWRRAVELVSGCALLAVSAYYANTFVALA